MVADLLMESTRNRYRKATVSSVADMMTKIHANKNI